MQNSMEITCKLVMPGNDYHTSVGAEIFVNTDGVIEIVFDTDGNNRVTFTNVGGKIIMNRYQCRDPLDEPVSSVVLNGDDCDEDFNPTS